MASGRPCPSLLAVRAPAASLPSAAMRYEAGPERRLDQEGPGRASGPGTRGAAPRGDPTGRPRCYGSPGRFSCVHGFPALGPFEGTPRRTRRRRYLGGLTVARLRPTPRVLRQDLKLPIPPITVPLTRSRTLWWPRRPSGSPTRTPDTSASAVLVMRCFSKQESSAGVAPSCAWSPAAIPKPGTWRPRRSSVISNPTNNSGPIRWTRSRPRGFSGRTGTKPAARPDRPARGGTPYPCVNAAARGAG